MQFHKTNIAEINTLFVSHDAFSFSLKTKTKTKTKQNKEQKNQKKTLL